jgi:polyisoprenoid-binding protein YceI
MKRILLAAALAATCLAGAPAWGFHYLLDARQSDVSAKVSILGLSSMTARFPDLAGDVQLAPDQLEAVTIDVTLDARTLTTDDESTREQLIGKDFFDAATHPRVRFVSSHMAMTGLRTAELFGDLTVRGVTRPVKFDVLFDQPPAQATGTQPISIIASTKINREDFGMTAMHVIISRLVTIRIQTVMTPG